MKTDKLSIKHVLLLVSCCILEGTSIGITGNCMGQFVTPLSEALKEPVGSVTVSITLTFLSDALFGPLIIAAIMKKINIKIIMSIGIIINSACLILLSSIHNLYSLYIIAIILGIANVCFNLVPITLLLNNWFYKNIGLFSGICVSFSGIVGALFNPIVANLIIKIGYQYTFIICGLIVLCLSLPCSLLFVHFHPREIGLKPYGYQEFLEKGLSEYSDGQKLPFYILVLIIVYAIVLSSVSGLNPSIAAMANSIPLSSSLSGTMVSVAMIGNVFSKLSLGILVDKFGSKFGITTMMISGTIGLLLLSTLNPESYWLALFGCMIYGCVFSCMANGIALLMREIYGPTQFLKYYPTVSLFSNVAYAVSVAIVGKSFDLFGTYSIIEIGLAFLSISSIIILFIIEVIQKKYVSVKNLIPR